MHSSCKGIASLLSCGCPLSSVRMIGVLLEGKQQQQPNPQKYNQNNQGEIIKGIARNQDLERDCRQGKQYVQSMEVKNWYDVAQSGWSLWFWAWEVVRAQVQGVYKSIKGFKWHIKVFIQFCIVNKEWLYLPLVVIANCEVVFNLTKRLMLLEWHSRKIDVVALEIVTRRRWQNLIRKKV